MGQVGTNIRRLLPSLALGILITVAALAFNYFLHVDHIPRTLMEQEESTVPVTAKTERQRFELGETPIASTLRFIMRIISSSDDFITDLMFSIRGEREGHDLGLDVVVVDIDEESVQHVGSWPWSRREIADLLSRLTDARVVGMDLLFDEPDKTSLVNFVEAFDSLYGRKLSLDGVDAESMDNDLYLANEMSRNRTVVGTVMHNGLPPPLMPDELIRNYTLSATMPNGTPAPQDKILLKRAAYANADIPVLRSGENPPLGEGFMNLFPSAGGLVRNISMLAHLPATAFADIDGDMLNIYPSLPLEMVRVALGGNHYQLRLTGHVFDFALNIDDKRVELERYPVAGIGIMRVNDAGEATTLLELPLNEVAELEVSFRNRLNDFEIIPAWEVLAGMHEGEFKDKVVLLGGRVEGLGIIYSGGLGTPGFSILDAHAAVLATISKGTFIESGYIDSYVWQQIMILFSGIAVTLALLFGSLGVGMTVSALAIVSLILANYLIFFKRGYDVGITMPLLSTLAVLISQGVATYLVIGRDRRFIRKAFSLNVSPSILGYLETHPDQLSSLQGQNREMTVLFSDIRGFTSISERMTAPDLARFLNEYFTPMSDIVMKNLGTVDKFIGDALMAFWNAPTDNPNHAKDAARSALNMVEELEKLQANWTERGLPKVTIGCGINSGPMFAGYMGSEQRKNYTVMGDNVNIASRLEGLNKIYSSSILITEYTKKLLDDEFICRVVDKVRVSGKEEALLIFELLGEGEPSPEEYEEIMSFSRVFELYQMREFAAAESLLKELVFIRPTPLYKMYLDRLAIYLALPPPDDWDGTFAMMEK
ncbi:MAG: adenylate/guanylate cyclase domain-containing protein [Planctomycetes bacterium]|nr:adenylate/guanylate cyclase domain-containing protein [Planctomycetota bacterium]